VSDSKFASSVDIIRHELEQVEPMEKKALFEGFRAKRGLTHVEGSVGRVDAALQGYDARITDLRSQLEGAAGKDEKALLTQLKSYERKAKELRAQRATLIGQGESHLTRLKGTHADPTKFLEHETRLMGMKHPAVAVTEHTKPFAAKEFVKKHWGKGLAVAGGLGAAALIAKRIKAKRAQEPQQEM